MTDENFKNLLDWHLDLIDSISRGSNVEQCRSEIDRLISRIDTVISNGQVATDNAVRLSMIKGYWRGPLSEDEYAVAPSSQTERIKIDRISLFAIIKGLSVGQIWSLLGALMLILIGSFSSGIYWEKLQCFSKINGLETNLNSIKEGLSTEKAKNDLLETQLKVKEKSLSLVQSKNKEIEIQLKLSRQERELYTLLFLFHFPNSGFSNKNIYTELMDLLKEMKNSGTAVIRMNNSSNVLHIELPRTKEVWNIRVPKP